MIPIILCGGSGTRLWPIVGKKSFYPFFRHSFLKGMDKNHGMRNLSLLDLTLDRLKKFEPLIIIGVQDLRSSIENILCKYSIKTELILEPEAKNTAASIAFICRLLQTRNKENEVIGIFPSDHLINKKAYFQKLVTVGAEIAQQEQNIVTFGISSDEQDLSSGYGYIKAENKIREIKNVLVYKATAFVEKPKVEKARLLAKSCFINSGIFLSPVHILLAHFKKYLPLLYKQVFSVKSNRGIYQNIKPVSFDKGVMEHLKDYICLHADIMWKDLGSWDAIAQFNQKNKLNNKATVFSKKAHSNFVFSSIPKSIACLGVKNMLICHSEQGLLVAEKNKITDNDIRHTAESFQDYRWKEQFDWIKKPWGAYFILKEEESLKIKKLKVNPKAALSYQSHQNRSEHWIILSGLAEVTIEGNKQKLKENESVFIARNTKHRLRNLNSKTYLMVLEIAKGNYLGEDDIIRYEDDYGRC